MGRGTAQNGGLRTPALDFRRYVVDKANEPERRVIEMTSKKEIEEIVEAITDAELFRKEGTLNAIAMALDELAPCNYSLYQKVIIAFADAVNSYEEENGHPWGA